MFYFVSISTSFISRISYCAYKFRCFINVLQIFAVFFVVAAVVANAAEGEVKKRETDLERCVPLNFHSRWLITCSCKKKYIFIYIISSHISGFYTWCFRAVVSRVAQPLHRKVSRWTKLRTVSLMVLTFLRRCGATRELSFRST